MEEAEKPNHIEQTFNRISHSRQSYVPGFAPKETGMVTSLSHGIAKVSGLPGAGYEELLKFSDRLYGIAFNLDEEDIGVVLLGQDENLKTGDLVERTGRVMDIPVGNAVLGRIINPLGAPQDDKGPIAFTSRLPIERPAPPIMFREAVNIPLQTGIKVIDAIIPIGRGQRELILGDRQTGKTSIAIDTLLNQKDKDILCVYCAIGQRASSLSKVVAALQANDALSYTTVIVTEGNDPPGLQYIAPYAATSIAEYFMGQGRDVLIVYDDLTQHARAYRELSLLLRRPPGREAFPGDIFYIHSRLLERATHLNKEHGGGSLTALPIIETEAQDLSAYIPTNLISITDGQLYLSPKLFELGVLPAVDIGKSVSRVGGKAQLPAYRTLAGNLKLAYAQFEELETFARFGTHLDASTTKIIEHGKRIREIFKQQEMQPVPVTEQLVLLIALTNGLFDEIPLSKMKAAEACIQNLARQLPADKLQSLASSEKQTPEEQEWLIRHARESLSSLFTPKDKDHG